ncbi:MAG: hypothetical protein J6F31_08500 [Oscillospiraceae bacterium]|nr:hypothetical protein [Oscillospiraceae bacterium]
MKLINRHNFLSLVCMSFTLIVCGKLLLEKLMGFTDRHYTENIFTCLAFSVMITAVLSLHYYLQSFPLIPVLIGQYLAIIGLVAGLVKLVDAVAGTTSDAMWQMLLSVTVPYVISAVIYYVSFFRQVKKANIILSELSEAE